jgi:hypothetical protein
MDRSAVSEVAVTVNVRVSPIVGQESRPLEVSHQSYKLRFIQDERPLSSRDVPIQRLKSVNCFLVTFNLGKEKLPKILSLVFSSESL